MENKNVIIHRLNTKLQELAPQVTSEDRKMAVKILDVDPITIMRYLNGKAKKPDTGIRLLQFLQSRINERNTILA